jgi:hypothetical protein
MKIIKFLLLGVLILCSSKVSAQWELGISGGYVYNTLSTSSGYFYNREYIPQGSFSAAIPIYYHFNDWFGLGTELSYIEKNYNIERYGSAYGPSTVYENERVVNSYFQLPIMANFSFGGKKLRGFTNAGIYLGAWMSSHLKGSALTQVDEYIYYYDEAYQFDSQRDNRFEYGLLISLGLKYQFSHSIGAFVEARYLYGLSDLQKYYMINQYPRYNSTAQIQLGIMYKFK